MRIRDIKILIHGYFGFGNVGDESVLVVIIDEFRRLFKDVDIIVLSANPERTVRLHGVGAVRERLLSLDFWRSFLSSHVLVFAGGGRYGYATWRRMAVLALLARLLGKAVVFRAVGVYPYEWRGLPVISRVPKPFRGLTGFLVRLAVSHASFVSVRDPYSLAVLKLTGVNRHIVLEDDLAFRLRPSKSDKCRDLAIKYGIVEGKVLAVNLRTLDRETNRLVVDYVSRLIQDYVRGGYDKVVFIPFGFGSFRDRPFDDDLVIAGLLKRHVPELIIINEELNPRDILCLFNYVSYVIAMRHHAVIFSLIMNKPLTAIVYDTKTLELLRRLSVNNVKVILIDDLRHEV